MAENIIIAIISLIGGGSVSGFIFWRITRRKALGEAKRIEEEANKATIDNAAAVTDEWQDLYNELKDRLEKTEAELKTELEQERDNFIKERDRAEKIYNDYLALREDKDARIRQLNKDNHELSVKIEEIKEENFKKDLEIDRLRIQKCEVRGCVNRRPPSDLMM